MILENYNLTTLAENPEYYTEVVQLIESGLNYNQSFHYDEDFNSLINTSNFQNCFFLIDKKTNQVVSHLACTDRIFIKNKTTIPITLVGGLVTHKNHRGKNLISFLLNHLFKMKKKSGLFLLWSELENFYEKFNFYKAGGSFETGKNIIANDQLPQNYYKTNFSLISEKEFSEIKKIYNENTCNQFLTLQRDEIDWNNIKNNKSTSLFICKTNGQITSYFCIGKGFDLQNVIHEFGSINFQKDIKEIEQFKLWLPETLLSQHPNRELFYTAFMRIGDIEVLNAFLSKTILHFNILSFQNNQVKFVFEGASYSLPANEFLESIFGPFPLEEFAPYKFSMYISGLDSV